MLLKVAGEQATIELEAEATFEHDDGFVLYGEDYPGTLTLLLPDGKEIAVRGKKLHQERIQQRA